MTRSGRRLIEDFLLPALDQQKYGDRLCWVNKDAGYFSIRWSHKNAAKWTLEDTIVFQDWDRLKGHFHPEIKGYYMQAKQRFRAALYKLSTVRKVCSKERHTKIYQLVLEDKKKSDMQAAHTKYNKDTKCIRTSVIRRNVNYNPINLVISERTEQKPLALDVGETEQKLTPAMIGEVADQKPMHDMISDVADQKPTPAMISEVADQKPVTNIIVNGDEMEVDKKPAPVKKESDAGFACMSSNDSHSDDASRTFSLVDKASALNDARALLDFHEKSMKVCMMNNPEVPLQLHFPEQRSTHVPVQRIPEYQRSNLGPHKLSTIKREKDITSRKEEEMDDCSQVLNLSVKRDPYQSTAIPISAR